MKSCKETPKSLAHKIRQDALRSMSLADARAAIRYAEWLESLPGPTDGALVAVPEPTSERSAIEAAVSLPDA